MRKAYLCWHQKRSLIPTSLFLWVTHNHLEWMTHGWVRFVFTRRYDFSEYR